MTALGRITPPDFEHVAKYALRALPEVDRPSAVPVILGVNWNRGFDPGALIQRKGPGGHVQYWVDEAADKTPIRGGHCIDLEPKGYTRTKNSYLFYNQLSEGICVGEGCSQAMTFLNNKRWYQPRWLYDRCKERDHIKGEGTLVRVGLDVLRELGHVRAKRGEEQGLTPGQYDSRTPNPQDGISANRWALSVDEISSALGYTEIPDSFDWMNSWGSSYPKVVKVPVTLIHRLVFEQDGEAGIVTDR